MQEGAEFFRLGGVVRLDLVGGEQLAWVVIFVQVDFAGGEFEVGDSHGDFFSDLFSGHGGSYL